MYTHTDCRGNREDCRPIPSVWLARFVILVPTHLHNSQYELREIVSPICVYFLIKGKKNNYEHRWESVPVSHPNPFTPVWCDWRRLILFISLSWSFPRPLPSPWLSRVRRTWHVAS